jgi:malonate decarboxylase gamma subunit
MTLDEFLDALFLQHHNISRQNGTLTGQATLKDGRVVEVIGVYDATPLGVDEAIRLSRHVLDALMRGGDNPIFVLVDSSSQRMSKRDELLGVNEFLGHLAKCLIWADMQGRRTLGVLYGSSLAAAIIVTALATSTLLAVPDAEPEVMDLPSMSKVTKLPLTVLEEKAKSTPVFAPGVDNMVKTGSVLEVCKNVTALADKIAGLLGALGDHNDNRGLLGRERGGRPKAADVAQRIHDLARSAS